MGFTERQAGFLVMVMLHAGVCMSRHYCAYARIRWGQKAHDFFTLLLERRYATARACGDQRARLYHLHHRPLYRAIGQEHNRHRKPMALPRAVERLMLLDAVLADRDLPWLATEDEKVTHFTLSLPVPRQDLPRVVFRGSESETTRYFPDKLPIAVAADGRTYVFVYLAARQEPVDFRGFLERHAELLRALPSWSIRLLVPRHLVDGIPAYRSAFAEHLASPLRPIVLDELRWYFRARRGAGDHGDERLHHASRAFGAPRFGALYRAWLERGEPVLDATLSPTLADAIARGTGGLDCRVLPHRYLHLLPLVGTA
jgi:hypothetical protein